MAFKIEMWHVFVACILVGLYIMLSNQGTFQSAYIKLGTEIECNQKLMEKKAEDPSRLFPDECAQYLLENKACLIDNCGLANGLSVELGWYIFYFSPEGEFEDWEQCEYDCVHNVEGVPPPAFECQDTETPSKNYIEKGTITTTYEEYTDYCHSDGERLMEYYCTNTNVAGWDKDIYYCSNMQKVCRLGACVDDPSPPPYDKCLTIKTNAQNGNYGQSSVWVAFDETPPQDDGTYSVYGYEKEASYPHVATVIDGQTLDGYDYRRYDSKYVYVWQGSGDIVWAFKKDFGAASQADLTCGGVVCGPRYEGEICTTTADCQCPFTCVAGACSSSTIGDGVCFGNEDCDNSPNDCACASGQTCTQGTWGWYCESPPQCNTPADNNPCDGIVSRLELGDYITKWISGQVTRLELGNAIQAWSGG